MTVAAVHTGAQAFTLTGTGYDPHGDFMHDGEAVRPQEDTHLTEALRAAALCNDASLEPGDGETWLRIVLVAASVLFIVELEKPLVRRWSGAAGERGWQPASTGNPR